MNFEKMYSTIDTHVAGEAFRIVIHSPIMLDKSGVELNQEQLRNSYQSEKLFLLNEPRGHRDMHGCLIMPSKVADYRLLFFNHDSEVQFQYGGLVTTITALLETGNLEKKLDGIYHIETSNGIYSVKAHIENQEVVSVYLESMECHLKKRGDNYSLVEVDGDRNYIIFSLPDSISSIHLDHLSSINGWGKEITNRFNQEPMLFDGIILTESINSSVNEVRSVTFERDGTIIRSPGFDSTFALFTLLLDETKEYREFRNQSIFNSELIAKVIEGSSNRFSIESEGFITGLHQFIYDQDDPLKNGFLLK